MSTPASSEDSHPGSDNVALTRSPGFWLLMRYAALFGVVLAFASAGVPGVGQGRHEALVHAPEEPRAGSTGASGGWR